MCYRSLFTLLWATVSLCDASSYHHESCADVSTETCASHNRLASLHKYSMIKCIDALDGDVCVELKQAVEATVNVSSLEAFNNWMCTNESDYLRICSDLYNCKLNLTDTLHTHLRNCSRSAKEREVHHLVCTENVTHAVQREMSMFHCLKNTLESNDESATCFTQSLDDMNVTGTAVDGDESLYFIQWYCRRTDVKATLHKIESNCINNERLSLHYSHCLRV